MGRFPPGRLLTADEIHAEYQKNIKPRAIEQLLHRWAAICNVQTPQKLWGEEMEWMLVRFKDDEKRIAAPIELESLRDRAVQEGAHVAHWSMECGCFQLETCTPEPYTAANNDLLRLEQNILKQQQFFRQHFLSELAGATKHDDDLLLLAQFPMIGCPHWTDPDSDGPSQPTQVPYPSIFANTNKMISSFAAQPDIFKIPLSNMLERNGGQKYFHVPIFVDEKTPQPFTENLAERYGGDERTAIVHEKAIQDHIVLEGYGVSLTNCAMQVTQQCANREEACFVYDQLAAVSPVFLALTAAAPFCRGYLTAWDSRWEVTQMGCELRSPAQRRPRSEVNVDEEAEEDQPVGLTRNRSIEMYASEDSEKLNDIPQTIDRQVYQWLTKKAQTGTMPNLFARYLSQFFVMEPVVLSDQELRDQTKKDFDLFTTVQDMTTWTIVRIKFPVLAQQQQQQSKKEKTLHIPTTEDEDDDVAASSNSANNDKSVTAGWRVEFRPMGVQFNAFQCSAFIVFIVLLTRALVKFHIDLRVPISLLETNIRESVRINAYRVAKFWWPTMPTLPGNRGVTKADQADDLVQLTAAEIMCGKKGEFIGLIPLVEHYLTGLHEGDDIMSNETKDKVEEYLKFLRDRANGKEKTVADWMRHFVRTHKDYKKDSFVPPNIMYDMMREYQKFQPL